jgi:broad-specificity NMP kinase
MLAVVITGPPGAGKTAALTALADALSDDDIPHAAIDLEALVWTHPALTDEEWSRHVDAACAVHRDADRGLLLVAQTLETDDDAEQLFGAVGADEYFVVRLDARPATLVERIVEREPAGWSGLDELVEHAQELAASMPALCRVDLVVSTQDAPAEDVAARIRAAGPPALNRYGPSG